MGISFKYPGNLKTVDISSALEKEKLKFLEHAKKETGIDVQVNMVDVDFYNSINKRVGFLRGISFYPYYKYGSLTKDEGIFDMVRTYKIDRRKNDRVHPKSYESVGYVRSGNNIFPWTVVDAGYKDVFSMSDILYYDEDMDSFASIEIRMFNHDEETKDILYGILKTIKFE